MAVETVLILLDFETPFPDSLSKNYSGTTNPKREIRNTKQIQNYNYRIQKLKAFSPSKSHL